MAREYLERLEAMLEPSVRKLGPGFKVEIKHFFSGAAAYADGRICISLTPAGLAMKIIQQLAIRWCKESVQPAIKKKTLESKENL